MEHQLRPDELMAELGIKKQAYYDYLKHLGIKAEKDSQGKAYLTQAQAKMMRSLREHVVAGGKIEDFDVDAWAEPGASDLVKSEPGQMDAGSGTTADPVEDLDLEQLYRDASEIAAQRLTAGEQVVLAMASQMEYSDLHPDTRAKVEQMRASAVPKFDPQAVAADLLQKCRQQAA